MTGEVSLRGVIMPIGGLPEKLMAAQRAGVKRVFIPEENTDDLADVAQEVKDELEIIPVHQVRDVLGRVGILDGETGSELRELMKGQDRKIFDIFTGDAYNNSNR